jgi:muramoyltetrapeptide carboxypeptidase
MNKHLEKTMWPRIPDFGSTPVTAGLVTLGAPDAGNNPDNVERALKWLRDRRVSAKWSQHALHTKGFLADDPEKLADDLHVMLQDPEVDLVLTTGGGANANEILPFLKPELLQAHPKPIMGMSNTTLILNYMTARSGVVSLHGPALVWNFGGETPLDAYTETHMMRALKGSTPFSVQPETSWQWLRAGNGQGPIWGGNLWSFDQLLGTPYAPHLAGGIFFIEDCFAELHNIAACLTHVRQCGGFQNLTGLVIGVPLECAETEMKDDRDFYALVMGACAGSTFPVLSGVQLGHTDTKITVPIGARSRLDSAKNLFEFTD